MNIVSLLVVCAYELTLDYDIRDFMDIDCAITCGTRRKLNNELEGETYDFY